MAVYTSFLKNASLTELFKEQYRALFNKWFQLLLLWEVETSNCRLWARTNGARSSTRSTSRSRRFRCSWRLAKRASAQDKSSDRTLFCPSISTQNGWNRSPKRLLSFDESPAVRAANLPKHWTCSLSTSRWWRAWTRSSKALLGAISSRTARTPFRTSSLAISTTIWFRFSITFCMIKRRRRASRRPIRLAVLAKLLWKRSTN